MILTNFLVLSCVQQWKNETKQVKYCFHVLILIIQSFYFDVVDCKIIQATSARNSYMQTVLIRSFSAAVKSVQTYFQIIINSLSL
jgi:hypothetical protein